MMLVFIMTIVITLSALFFLRVIFFLPQHKPMIVLIMISFL